MKFRGISLFSLVFALLGHSLALGDAKDPHWCGNKHANLVRLKTILAGEKGVSVPEFIGIPSARVEDFLRQKDSQALPLRTTLFANIETLSSNLKMFELKNNRADMLSSDIKWLITEYFSDPFTSYTPFPFTPTEQQFFQKIAGEGRFLMVRSTGIEDSQTVANAGGNATVAYVNPDDKSISRAMGTVVSSYFGLQSLKNRIGGGEEPSVELCIPVLIQALVGETPGGETDPRKIPISGVAFTTNQALSAPGFSVTEINAAPGHGEGVVANKVLADRYLITESRINKNDLMIYPTIQMKAERLVRMKDGELLVLHKNSSEMAHSSALSPDQIKKLYHVLKKIEAAYGQPMDVEFVVIDTMIYIVQARPAMRQPANPSYLDYSAIDPKNIEGSVHGTTLVSGTSQVVIITDPKDIIVAQTLDDADQASNSTTCKAVVVGNWASPLSHAAVNFTSHGIPCLYVQNISEAQALAAKISSITPLIVDIQQRTVSLWKDENIGFIKKYLGDNRRSISRFERQGWLEHPVDRTCSLFLKDIPVTSVHTQTLPHDGQLMDALKKLKNSSAPKERQDALNFIKDRIEKRLSITEKRIQYFGSLIEKPFKDAFDVFKKIYSAHVAELQAAIQNNADNFEILFHHKMLEALIYQDHSHNSSLVGTYSYAYFLNDLFANKNVFNLLKKLSRGASATSNAQELAAFVKYCPSSELSQKWQEYLIKINTSEAKAAIPAFKQILEQFEKVKCIALWFATDFYRATNQQQAIPEPSMIVKIAKEYTARPMVFTQQIEAIQQAVATLSAQRGTTFTSAQSARSLWQNIKTNVIDPLTSKSFIAEFPKAPLAVKIATCDLMRATVDLLDSTIKIVKTSPALSDSEKQTLFKTMLTDFHHVMHTWLLEVMPENALRYHSAWSRQSYVDQVQQLLDDIMGNSIQFQRSHNFSVNAAMIGSSTDFSRHYPETGEDLFMLIHQNSLVAVAATYSSLFDAHKTLIEQIYLPEIMQKFLTYLDTPECKQLFNQNNIGYPQRIGIQYSPETIELHYNMALNNHSSTFQIVYNRMTQQCTFNLQFLSSARSRWRQISILMRISPDFSGLSLADSLLDETAGIVSCSWSVNSAGEFPVIMKYVTTLAQIANKQPNSIDLRYINQLHPAGAARNAKLRQALMAYEQKYGSDTFTRQFLNDIQQNA